MLEIVIDRSRDSIRAAIGDFAARMGYRLYSSRWFGTWIRRPRSGFPAAKIRIRELARQRGSTIIRLHLTNRKKCWDLAYELRAFLLDDRAYDRDRPTMCPACKQPIANLAAAFCGACGVSLTPESDT